MSSSPGAGLTAQIEELLAASRTYNGDQAGQSTRLRKLEMVQNIHAQLETPKEALMGQLMNYSETSSIRSLRQMGALQKIPREGIMSAKQLSAEVGANEEVIKRLMRILTGSGVLKASGEDGFAHTPKSLIYFEEAAIEFWDLCIDEIASVAYALPNYISSHGKDAIFDPRQSPFSWYNKAEGKTFYEFLLDHPDRLKRFNVAMTTEEKELPVLGMFPFVSLLDVPADSGRAFFVDVAGGRGQSLLQIKRELEAAEGSATNGKKKFILQDREKVLDSVTEEQLPGVEKMVIDFFQGQPIKHAHNYYLRRIMHNWQDAECTTILRHVASCMAADSRLLIGEMVVTEKPAGVDKTVYWMDLCMLIIGGKERSEKEFSTILKAAGLRLERIWRSQGSSQTVIECRLEDGV